MYRKSRQHEKRQLSISENKLQFRTSLNSLVVNLFFRTEITFVNIAIIHYYIQEINNITQLKHVY